MNPARLLPLLALLGCGARSSLDPCPEAPPTCIQRDAAFPCGEPTLVAPTCDPLQYAWACPAGAHPYARASSAPPTCLPFHDAGGPVATLDGSLIQVPTDDGRCLWVAEDVTLTNGTALRNVAFDPGLDQPFGTCPTSAPLALEPIVTIEGGDDPTLQVQLDGGYRLGGTTHVIYRLFQMAAGAPLGLVELGGGVGHWDAAQGKVVVAGPGALAWGADLDLGNGILDTPTSAYVGGCPGPPHALTEDCLLAKLDAKDALSVLSTGGLWIPTTSPQGSAIAYQSGPWISALTSTSSGGLIHIYAPGFGTTLETHTASVPSGPWIAGATLATCDLPATDPKAFCAGPVVHKAMFDPTRPGERVITYGAGTTAPASANPDDAWTRLVWIE